MLDISRCPKIWGYPQKDGLQGNIPLKWMIQGCSIPILGNPHMDIDYWLVVEPPLWRIWLRQLGWWNSLWKSKNCSEPPTRLVITGYFYGIIHSINGALVVLITGILGHSWVDTQSTSKMSHMHAYAGCSKCDLSDMAQQMVLAMIFFCFVLEG